MELIVWALSCYGMAFIIIWGSIFDRPRNWIKNHSTFYGDLLSCIVCTGTWVGFFMSILVWSPGAHYFNTNILMSVFADGCLAAATCYIINLLTDRLDN
jgi:hypothetical protein